jgi:hypothetical protein
VTTLSQPVLGCTEVLSRAGGPATWLVGKGGLLLLPALLQQGLEAGLVAEGVEPGVQPKSPDGDGELVGSVESVVEDIDRLLCIAKYRVDQGEGLSVSWTCPQISLSPRDLNTRVTDRVLLSLQKRMRQAEARFICSRSAWKRGCLCRGAKRNDPLTP